MIDYNKLKYAHELAIKWQILSESPVIISTMISGFEDKEFIDIRMSSKQGHISYGSMDNLIKTLEDLTND